MLRSRDSDVLKGLLSPLSAVPPVWACAHLDGTLPMLSVWGLSCFLLPKTMTRLAETHPVSSLLHPFLCFFLLLPSSIQLGFGEGAVTI